jgi:hypothetical protein
VEDVEDAIGGSTNVLVWCVLERERQRGSLGG